jgi:hypothetical protein
MRPNLNQVFPVRFLSIQEFSRWVFPYLVVSLNTSPLSPDAHTPTSFHSFIIKLQFISNILHNYQNIGNAKLFGNQIIMVGVTAYTVKAQGC